MLDHPVTQKVLATVVAAGILATSGVAWNTRQLTERHDADIKHLQAERESQNELLGQIRSDVGEIKTGVAVLKERTEHYDSHGKPRT